MKVVEHKIQEVKRVGAFYGSTSSHTIYTYSCLRLSFDYGFIKHVNTRHTLANFKLVYNEKYY